MVYMDCLINLTVELIHAVASYLLVLSWFIVASWLVSWLFYFGDRNNTSYNIKLTSPWGVKLNFCQGIMLIHLANARFIHVGAELISFRLERAFPWGIWLFHLRDQSNWSFCFIRTHHLSSFFYSHTPLTMHKSFINLNHNLNHCKDQFQDYTLGLLKFIKYWYRFILNLDLPRIYRDQIPWGANLL